MRILLSIGQRKRDLATETINKFNEVYLLAITLTILKCCGSVLTLNFVNAA